MDLSSDARMLTTPKIENEANNSSIIIVGSDVESQKDSTRMH